MTMNVSAEALAAATAVVSDTLCSDSEETIAQVINPHFAGLRVRIEELEAALESVRSQIARGGSYWLLHRIARLVDRVLPTLEGGAR